MAIYMFSSNEQIIETVQIGIKKKKRTEKLFYYLSTFSLTESPSQQAVHSPKPNRGAFF